MGRSKDLTPEETAWLDLARGIARPASPRLAPVRAALAERPVDPREAWEVLATRELVAEHWVARGPLDVATWTERGAAPATLASVEALACDPDGVARVEALALELARRLAPWQDRDAATRVVWRTVPWATPRFPVPTSFAIRPGFGAMDALWKDGRWGAKEDGALGRSVERALRPVSGRPSGTVTEAKPPLRADDPPWMKHFWQRDGAGQYAIYHIKNRALWAQSVALDLRVADDRDDHVGGQAFGALLDPAEPLLEVWRAGYVVGDVDDVVTVFVPERAPAAT
ncbi:MAG: hypothetical protein U0324_03435 [Polyangiales bacterium]